ncbi:MAG: ABC transporter permease, partial [Caldisericia bacterium]
MEQKSEFYFIWKYLKKNKTAMIGLFIISVLIIVAILANVISPFDPYSQSLKDRLQPGFWKDNSVNILGTDEFGRDILSRIIYGSRVSLTVGFIAVIIGVLIGSIFGILSGYFGGWIDSVVMRGVDVMFSLPSILLAIVIMAILGTGLDKAMIAIGITYAPQIARIVRSQTIVVKNMEFVESALSIGESHLMIILKHILRNILSPIIVYGTLSIGSAILDAAALGFLGLGAQPPTPEWGAMLSRSYQYIVAGAWWVATFPGVMILIS